MRRHDHGPPARRKQPVKLFHRTDYVRHVLDDMNSPNLAECAIAKRKRIVVQVGYHICARVRIAVEANRARIFIDPAADVEDRKLVGSVGQTIAFCRLPLLSYSRTAKHCSSVSMAKSAWSRLITSGGHSRILFAPAPKTSNPRSNAIFSSRSRISGARSFVC